MVKSTLYRERALRATMLTDLKTLVSGGTTLGSEVPGTLGRGRASSLERHRHQPERPRRTPDLRHLHRSRWVFA
jgi:hypothetical protein